MSPELRALLDGPELPCDHWLYRLQEIIGFDHPACALIEKLRGLAKYFESRMPVNLPQPTDADRNIVRGSIGKIKARISDAWDRNELDAADKIKAREFHKLANDILRSLGIDVRPPCARSEVMVSPYEWCVHLGNLSRCLEAIDQVQADLELLADAGIVINDQPFPAPDNVMYSISRMKADASAVFGGRSRQKYLVCRFHRDMKALREELETEGLAPKRGTR